ncbi:MAG: flagellar hook-basal body protein [Nitrospiraceae bacterium]
MNRGIYPILSGALAQERQIQAFAHNIANVNTTGFKQEDSMFRTQIVQHMKVLPMLGTDTLAGRMWSPDTQVAERVFVSPNGSKTMFESGRLRPTGNPFDFAVQGTGFFEVKTPQGLRYTRDGVFHVDPKRNLVTEEGHTVMGVKGPIKVPVGDLQVDANGTLSVNNQAVGQLKIVEFPENKMPMRMPDGMYDGTGGKVAKAPRVLSGAVEDSNVNPLGEMVKLIQGMRTYESAQKIIQAFDKMAEQAVNELGKVQA